MNIRFAGLLSGASLLAIAHISAAYAQDANTTQPSNGSNSQKSKSSDDIETIVVTGTLIKGQPPIGSTLITVGPAEIQATAAQTPDELLGSIPQVTNLFNQDASRNYSVATNQKQIIRPNLRFLSPDNASSASTLVLFDGMRVASEGVTQASIDPDIIPTAAIQRVETVLDGGSAIYGSDAVGGVINFVTRRRFDGAQIDAHYGFADNYWQTDANAIVGTDWGTGSAYLAYSFNRNNQLFGRDRSWIKDRDFTTTPPSLTDNTCATPNITAGGMKFTGSGSSFAPGTTLCDNTDNSSFIPDVVSNNLFASVSQDLTSDLTVDVHGFYSDRKTTDSGQQNVTGLSITPSNYYYQTMPGTSPTATQSATFNLTPAIGLPTASGTEAKEFGGNAQVFYNINNDWQLRTLFNYSASDSSSFINGYNPTAMNAAGQGTTAATAIDPYDVAKTDPSLLKTLLNDQTYVGQTKDQLANFRTVVEGPLFHLPGGDVHAALGYEYMLDRLQEHTTQNMVKGGLSTIPLVGYERNVHSVFGEVDIPLVGDGNAMPGIQSLVISAQGRYDDYSDFGSTFDPKIGVNYKPVDWLTLRGNWSKSFNAPTPLDQLQSKNNFVIDVPFAAFTRPGDSICFTCGQTVAVEGADPDLKPQKAKSWSVGFDADLPFAEGLTTSFDYYNVVFNNILQTPTPGVGIFTNFPQLVQTSVTGLPAAQVRAFEHFAPNGATIIEPLLNQAVPPLIYELVDFRTGNFGVLKTDGLDWAVGYTRETGFRSVDASVDGNYILDRTTQVSATSPVVDGLGPNGFPKLFMKTDVGANIGNFRAQATWNYTGGHLLLVTNTLPQSKLSAFNTVDLFFKYDVDGQGIYQDLSFTLNVKNVFDQAPPIFKATGAGGFQGFTVGREFIFGLSKKF